MCFLHISGQPASYTSSAQQPHVANGYYARQNTARGQINAGSFQLWHDKLISNMNRIRNKAEKEKKNNYPFSGSNSSSNSLKPFLIPLIHTLPLSLWLSGVQPHSWPSRLPNSEPLRGEPRACLSAPRLLPCFLQASSLTEDSAPAFCFAECLSSLAPTCPSPPDLGLNFLHLPCYGVPTSLLAAPASSSQTISTSQDRKFIRNGMNIWGKKVGGLKELREKYSERWFRKFKMGDFGD